LWKLEISNQWMLEQLKGRVLWNFIWLQILIDGTLYLEGVLKMTMHVMIFIIFYEN